MASTVRAHLARRARSSSLSAVPPPPTSADYSTALARAATSILYRSPLPSKEGRPVFVLNSAALPDTKEVDFDALLPYVLARLPEEDELVKGFEYEVVFFAGDSDGATAARKNRPRWGWWIQAYHVLSRAMRKRLQRLYIVHEKAWVRILTEIFSSIVSPKFRRKIFHCTCRCSADQALSDVCPGSSMTYLAYNIPIEDLLIPPSAYLSDRRVANQIFAPFASGRRAFGMRRPLPINADGKTRLPRVLRETSTFLLMDENVTSEGLFRIPPHLKLKEVLKEAYDRGQKFVVWKDNGASLPFPPYPRAEHLDEALQETDPKDAFGVTMAAGLTKGWYSSLDQPIFPPESYRDLKRLYGNPDDGISLERVTDLISPRSDWSILPATSREILVRHLLPLLDAVAARQKENKMGAENLAVCIAPSLLRGPDQVEDAKMSSIVRRIVAAAVELWPEGLREACGVQPGAFRDDIRLPESPSDWEDPLEGKEHGLDKEDKDAKDDKHTTGITLEDREEEASRAPPLPRRPINTQVDARPSRSPASSIHRKPTPSQAKSPTCSPTAPGSPRTAADSPSRAAEAGTGVTARRPSQQSASDDRSPGTNGSGGWPSHAAPVVMPKRKALTAAQMDNAESIVMARALPGLTTAGMDAVWRKSIAQSAPPTATGAESAPWRRPADAHALSPVEVRRPSVRVASLAAPVYPSGDAPAPGRGVAKSATLPVPATKRRTPSPGLLQRMPSLDGPVDSSASRSGLAPPQKLDLRKKSVDDLRRLYEDRAGTAKTLVEASKRK